MISRTSKAFRTDFAALPQQVRRQAKEAYRLFAIDPQHPSLKFKKLPPFEDIWSVRISDSYRSVGRRRGDLIVWFFIGARADYDKLLARM